MLASIPSPGSGSIDLGPLTFRAYGVMIALGVLAAVWLVGRRFAARGIDPDHATGLAMWAVPAGLVGARLNHVITDWRSFQGRWGDVVKIWEGGLGILGGVLLGAVAGIAYMRRHAIPLGVGLDVAAPSLPLAQAIARWGNWFNQELFGRPTDLPWGLEIDPEHRPDGYADVETFHPTFLYESLWNVGVFAFLLWLERRGRLRTGRLLAAYFAAYAVGRLWVESLRIDRATEVAGLRVNLWIYGVVLLVALVVLFRGLRRPGDDDATPGTDPDGTDTSDVDSDEDELDDEDDLGLADADAEQGDVDVDGDVLAGSDDER